MGGVGGGAEPLPPRCSPHALLSAEKPEEPPAKLLDDLFRKTKAAPCIYWLPLTEEQVRGVVAGAFSFLTFPPQM